LGWENGTCIKVLALLHKCFLETSPIFISDYAPMKLSITRIWRTVANKPTLKIQFQGQFPCEKPTLEITAFSWVVVLRKPPLKI